MQRKAGRLGAVLKMAAGAAVTVVLVALSVKDLGSLNPARLLTASVNWWWAAVSGLLFAGASWFHGLCYPRGIDPGLSPLAAFRITAVGSAMNLLLPFKMGEGFRLALFPHGYSALRRVKLTLLPSAGDMACILASGVGAALFAGFGSPRMIRLLAGATLLIAVGCAAVCLIVPFVPRADAAARAMPRRQLGGMLLWVAVSWVMLLGSMLAALLAAGFSFRFAPRAALFLFAALNFVALVPSSPGALGLFEYAVAHSLQTMGVPAAESLNAALLLHAIQYLSLVPLGLALWMAPVLRRRRKNAKSAFHARRDLL